MQAFFQRVNALLPTGVDLIGIGKFLLILFAACLVLGFFAKLLFGKGSGLNRTLRTAIGILFLYAAAMAIYTFQPGNLARYLSPLPYVAFSGQQMHLFSFTGTHYTVICHQVLSMIILAFLYHLMEDFLPQGKGLHWLIYRILTILMSLALHYVVSWASSTYLPGVLMTYAPTVLFVLLISTMLLGALKVVLGVILAVVNPLLAALYAFFFSSRVGKLLTQAVGSTVIITGIVAALHHFGYTVVNVSQSSLIAYGPAALILLLIWYILSVVL